MKHWQGISFFFKLSTKRIFRHFLTCSMLSLVQERGVIVTQCTQQCSSVWYRVLPRPAENLTPPPFPHPSYSFSPSWLTTWNAPRSATSLVMATRNSHRLTRDRLWPHPLERYLSEQRELHRYMSLLKLIMSESNHLECE